MITYLVTGGAGFIGSNFIKYILDKYDNDIAVINVDCLAYSGNPENLKDIAGRGNYAFRKTDICDKEGIEDIFETYDIDYTVNFAAENHVDRSILDPGLFVRTNVSGTVNLLDAARKRWQAGGAFKENKKFIQISTDEVYGSLGDAGYFTESTPLDPHSPYSASKASADMIVKSFFDTYNMPVQITRCSNNYGPHQFPEKLIPLVINNILALKNAPLYGDGKNIRDWIYVKDHCAAVDLVIQKGKPGEVYNIGGGNERRNIEIVSKIIETVSALLPAGDERKEKINGGLIKYVTDRKGHDRRYGVDFSKIQRELGFRPSVDFETGIKMTVEWYLSNYDTV